MKTPINFIVLIMKDPSSKTEDFAAEKVSKTEE